MALVAALRRHVAALAGDIRGRFAPMPGARAARGFALQAAAGIATPLLVGALTHHPRQGDAVAIGAAVVCVPLLVGTYPARATTLATRSVSVFLAAVLAHALAGAPWPRVAVLVLSAGFGALVPRAGNTLTLGLVLMGSAPRAADVAGVPGVWSLVGCAWLALLVLAGWPRHPAHPLLAALSAATRAVADRVQTIAADLDERELARRRAVLRAAFAATRDAVAPYRLDTGAMEMTTLHEAGPRAARDLDQFLRSADEDASIVRGVALLLDGHDLGGWREPLAELTGTVAAALGAAAAALDAPVSRSLTGLRPSLHALAPSLPFLATAAPALAAASDEGTASADDAAHRLAERHAEVRREALAGRGALAGVAVLGQLRRAAARLQADAAAAVDAAARLAANRPHGARAARRLPSRADLRALIDLSPPRRRHAARVCLGVGVAFSLVTATHLAHGQWLGLAVLITIQPTYGDTAARSVHRVLGNLFAGVGTAAILGLHPPGVVLALLVGLFALLGFGLRPLNYGFWVVFGTNLLLLLGDFAMPLAWDRAGLRVLLNLAGGFIALATVRWALPDPVDRRAGEAVASLLDAHAVLARRVADHVERADAQADRAVSDARREAAASGAALAAMRRRIAATPHPPADVDAALGRILASGARIREGLLTVTGAVRDGSAPTDAGEITGALRLFGDALARAAAARRGSDARPAGMGMLSAAVAELDEEVERLEALRRAELRAGAQDESTPARRALGLAAAAHEALRRLADDERELDRALAA